MIEFKGNYWYKITYIDRRQEVVLYVVKQKCTNC